MSIYLRGDVWYYLFYVSGRRYRGSTRTKNEKEALRVEARKRVVAEQGESLRPPRIPLLREFVKPFEAWLDKATLAVNTKNDYKNGRRLILKTPLSGMRMDRITADDVETMNFHESPHSRNSAIRTLRRMLGKARDWKLLREVPRIKTVKVFPRDRMVSLEDEIGFVKEYLDLERMRFGSRLNVEWSVPPSTHALLVPQMILQPVVENAIRHAGKVWLRLQHFIREAGDFFDVVLTFAGFLELILGLDQ